MNAKFNVSRLFMVSCSLHSLLSSSNMLKCAEIICCLRNIILKMCKRHDNYSAAKM